MNVVVFGTYESWRYPRVQVLIEGLRAHGDTVVECNRPLDLSTDARMALLRRPWRAFAFARRLRREWRELRRMAARIADPDAVLVPYMGHFDVHAARRAWPRATLVLDHLISAADTAGDRGVAGAPLRALLRALDAAAVRRADLVVVDTEEHLRRLPAPARERACIVPVGAPAAFFADVPAPAGIDAAAPADAVPAARMKVGFFGIYTPLHGTRIIAEAIAQLRDAPIDFVMVGNGQEREEARRIASANPNVAWIDWLTMEALPREMRTWDVSLGVFATTPKSLRVVPHKVFLGAASGCAIVTSDTPPQRRALAESAELVPPGDAAALAARLRALAGNPLRLAQARMRAAQHARAHFAPRGVVTPLRSAIASQSPTVRARQRRLAGAASG